jgi:hypothetical protein
VSLIFDAKSITVDADEPIEFSMPGIRNVDVSIDNPVTKVEVNVPNTVSEVAVEVPGLQGAPGLQNVYIRDTSPAIDFGWGMNEKDYVWIKI